MRRAVARNILLLALVTVSATQLRCKDTLTEAGLEPRSEPESTCPFQEEFCGSWNWLYTCGGVTGGCTSPDSAGYALTYNLTETGEFEIVVDDTVRVAGSFSIIAENSRLAIRYDARIGAWNGRHWISLRSLDTLELDDGCCDMFSHTFARIKEP